MSPEPGQKYRTIVADPPWRYEQFIPSRTPSIGLEHPRSPLPYGMLGVGEIQALPVRSLAADDARLFLWTTSRYLLSAGEVLASWGFEYRQVIVWRKTGRLSPLPAVVAPNHAEFLLVGHRGNPSREKPAQSSVIDAPRGAHSQKPEVFLDMIEAVSPGPYVELFARRARFGWDYWGDESLGTAEMPERVA